MFAQRKDSGIARFSLGAVVRTEIVVVAVTIVLAIGLVVLPVVADEIPEGKPVVGGEEIDARPWATLPKKILAPGESAVETFTYDVVNAGGFAIRRP